jgi:hypothetical protein
MTSYGKIVSAAVETGLDWLIHTFGDEERRARSEREVAREWRASDAHVRGCS